MMTPPDLDPAPVGRRRAAILADRPASDRELPISELTRIHRYRQFQLTDRSAMHDVLDAALVAHVAWVRDGRPAVSSLGYVRDGDTILVHGSKRAGVLTAGRDRAPLAVTVNLLDGLVYAPTLFDSTLNYRSVVVHGTAEAVEEPDAKVAALRLLSERLMPGRWEHVAPPTSQQLRSSLVLRMSLETASLKVRSGPPDQEPIDGIWTGELPLTGQVADTPRTQPGCQESVPEIVNQAARLLHEMSQARR